MYTRSRFLKTGISCKAKQCWKIFKGIADITNTYYYSIKEVDKDNNFKYSSVLKVAMNNDKFAVFPNPIKEMITASGLSGTGVIKIILLDGKNVLT